MARWNYDWEEADIDFEALREDLSSENLGAYFGGDFGAALVEEMDIRYASNRELISIAREKGYDLANYRIKTKA